MSNKQQNQKIQKKQNRQRKYSENYQRKYQERPQTWRCQICKTDNPNWHQFCIPCYIDLHYYSYVNMHMFVESDNSYQ